MDIRNINNFCLDLGFDTKRQLEEQVTPDHVLRAALMPDAHLGYGVPIGSVIETSEVVYPEWVGYDIGCGMCTVMVNLIPDIQTREMLQRLQEGITKCCPTSKRSSEDIIHFKSKRFPSRIAQDAYIKRGSVYQHGTIGSGNHFIEVGKSTRDPWEVFIMIHSGSRGLGHEIAGKYMEVSRGKGLTGTLRNEYLEDHDYAIEYALSNRYAMLKAIESFTGIEIYWDTLINKVHNFVESKEDNIYLHRKGATSAELGEDVIIPGNMLDGVAIGEGLGNKQSLESCSHGAGRRMGRGEAKRTLSQETFEDQMKYVSTGDLKGKLDESPDAYKDFGIVLESQKGILFEQTDHLESFVNVKG